MCTKSHNQMKYSFWDTELDGIFLSFWAIFCLFTPTLLTTQKTTILKKWKKYLEVSSFWTCATKNTIIWCMLTQTWSVTDIIFCHFMPFFALLPHYWPPKLKFGKNVKKKPRNIILLHMCTINQDHMMYDFWDIKSKGEFLVILGNFCPLTLLKTQKIKILKK